MIYASRVLFALVFTLALAVVPRSAEAGGPNCPGYDGISFCGELSGDCKITATDALFALRMSVDQLPQSEVADLDHSFTVTAGDALRILRISVGSVELLLGCGATQYSVKATHFGFYADTGVLFPNNYATGWYNAPSSSEGRSFFVFDVSGIPGTVLGARLHLATGDPVYKSPDPTETFTVFAVEASVAALTGGTGGTDAFADLGDGEVYGTFIAGSTDGDLVNVQLNFDAVGYINDATDEVVFGGALTTLMNGEDDEYIFNSTHVTNTRELVLLIAQ